MRAAVRKGILFTALGSVVALVSLGPPRPASNSRPVPPAAQVAAKAAVTDGNKAVQAPSSLPDRLTLKEPVGTLFGAPAPPPPAPKVVAAPVAPSPPPMPYRFAGKVLIDGKQHIFLSKKNVAIPVVAGGTLEDGYRVESIEADRVVLVYTPLNHREAVFFSEPAKTAGARTNRTPFPSLSARTAVPASPGAGHAQMGTIATPSVVGAGMSARGAQTSPASQQKAGSARARLLWSGPAQVKLGASFSVALRLTSGKPVHSLPMQVRYDPTVLETVAIKPGRFLEQSDRNFNYRVNADGSIFIGATNTGAAPAADAELLVLTFRAIKPAPSAELSLASLNLQGAGGQAIAFDSLAAFNTRVVP